MTSGSMITLYEPASQSNKSWNPITLRARYALNFKGIPYETIMLEYPDIEPTLRSIGAAPTAVKPNGEPFYTVPVIVDPTRRTANGGPTIVSDSWLIAEYLDDAYPDTKPLFPDGTKALQAVFLDHFNQTVFIHGAPLTVALVHPFLNEASRSYWRLGREAYFGCRLEDICPEGSPKWEETWKIVQNGFSNLAALLDKNVAEDGPFIMGAKVSFVDFILAATFDTIVIMLPGGWEKIRHWDGGKWERLRDGCAAWRSED